MTFLVQQISGLESFDLERWLDVGSAPNHPSKSLLRPKVKLQVFSDPQNIAVEEISQKLCLYDALPELGEA